MRAGSFDPAVYAAWYHSPRGAWIGRRELALLLQLMKPEPGHGLLDVGCGTGWFSRGFAAAGLGVTGIDPDPRMLGYARGQDGAVSYVEGDALSLPFSDGAFDWCSAVTSLCFVERPEQALAEMWRVSRLGVVLGLLHRHSLLYRHKHGSGSYRGARWDSRADVRRWLQRLVPAPRAWCRRTAILLPGGGPVARVVERLAGGRLPWGGFLAVHIVKHG